MNDGNRDELWDAFEAELTSVSTPRDLQSLRDRYLGRKGGRITSLYAGLATVPPEQKRELGARLNQLKAKVEAALDRHAGTLATAAPPPPRLDPTLAGRRPVIGHSHPLTYLRTRIEAYFAAAGYEILDGPETEDDYHNFEALNLPADHPARDMQDTLYLEKPWTRAVFPVGRSSRPRGSGPRVRSATGNPRTGTLRSRSSPRRTRSTRRTRGSSTTSPVRRAWRAAVRTPSATCRSRSASMPRSPSSRRRTRTSRRSGASPSFQPSPGRRTPPARARRPGTGSASDRRC